MVALTGDIVITSKLKDSWRVPEGEVQVWPCRGPAIPLWRFRSEASIGHRERQETTFSLSVRMLSGECHSIDLRTGLKCIASVRARPLTITGSDAEVARARPTLKAMSSRQRPQTQFVQGVVPGLAALRGRKRIDELHHTPKSVMHTFPEAMSRHGKTRQYWLL